MDKTLIFLHIPKTGGTTLRRFLDKQYGVASEEDWSKGVYYIYAARDSRNVWQMIYDCETHCPEVLAGHFGYGAHRFFNRACEYITLLRHPVDRVVSNFTWVTNNVDNPTFPQFARYKNWTLERYVEEELTQGSHGDNAMTKTLVYCPHRFKRDEWLKVAKATLKNEISLFGLTEQFDDFIKLGAKKFGWGTNYTIENVSSNKIVPSNDQRKLIENHCELDLELYEYAVELFTQKFLPDLML